MALRTAPCPSCSSTIVFGERKCRKCAMVFDYGPNPPPEPTQTEVFDALLAHDSKSTPAARPAAAAAAKTQPSQPPISSSSPTPPARPAAQAPTTTMPPSMEGLDTGRFSVGDVEVEDIPGFIDSSLFKAMTPEKVDAVVIPGFEGTLRDIGAVNAIAAVDVDTGRAADVGDVGGAAAVPGLYGSDMFKADVDIAAGADGSAMLETTTIKVKSKAPTTPGKGKKVADEDLPRTLCSNCGATHAKPRCPACATPHPLAES